MHVLYRLSQKHVHHGNFLMFAIDVCFSVNWTENAGYVYFSLHFLVAGQLLGGDDQSEWKALLKRAIFVAFIGLFFVVLCRDFSGSISYTFQSTDTNAHFLLLL